MMVAVALMFDMAWGSTCITNKLARQKPKNQKAMSTGARGLHSAGALWPGLGAYVRGSQCIVGLKIGPGR